MLDGKTLASGIQYPASIGKKKDRPVVGRSFSLAGV